MGLDLDPEKIVTKDKKQKKIEIKKIENQKKQE